MTEQNRYIKLIGSNLRFDYDNSQTPYFEGVLQDVFEEVDGSQQFEIIDKRGKQVFLNSKKILKIEVN